MDNCTPSQQDGNVENSRINVCSYWLYHNSTFKSKAHKLYGEKGKFSLAQTYPTDTACIYGNDNSDFN